MSGSTGSISADPNPDGGRFEVSRRPRLVVRSGLIREMPTILQRDGRRAVAVITGGRSVRGRDEWAQLVEELLESGLDFQEFTVRGEPGPDTVDRIAAECRQDLAGCDAVLAIGGGSVIDAAKAVAAMLALRGNAAVSVREYLEGVGSRVPTGLTLPLYAMPTTAGTGSEATRNAVISETGPGGFKKSLRHEHYVPVAALIDPELHVGCPPVVTRASGLDAITQLLEAFVSTRANPLTDALCREGLRLAGGALPQLLAGRDTPELRSAMALAAHFSGIALAQAGLGLVHGFASPLGAAHDIPHGVVCGLLVGPVTRATCAEAGAPIHRYTEAAALLGREKADGVDALTGWLDELARPLGCLSDYGFAADELAGLARASGNKNNPVQLTEEIRFTLLAGVLSPDAGGALS